MLTGAFGGEAARGLTRNTNNSVMTHSEIKFKVRDEARLNFNFISIN
jgi:hypothetical protein